MSAQKYLSYTYLIGWSSLDLWYYGARTANVCKPEDDLWIHYFSSSKYVKETRLQENEPDIIQVRRTFSTIKEAFTFESKVLMMLDAKNSAKWLNRNNGSLDRTACSHETREKLSKARKGKPLSTTHRANIGNALRGNRSDENNPFYGHKHSSENIQKYRNDKLGAKNPNFIGNFITPWGSFQSSGLAQENCNFTITAASIRDWCIHRNLDVVSSRSKLAKHLGKNVIGKTHNEIGFDFIPK